MGRAKKHLRCFFVELNTCMITNIKFSGLFIPKQISPVGNADGYYVKSAPVPVVPVTNYPVKL
jgi:hypothetical protein